MPVRRRVLPLVSLTYLLPALSCVVLSVGCGPLPNEPGETADDDDDDDDSLTEFGCARPADDEFVIGLGWLHYFEGEVTFRPPEAFELKEETSTLWWRDTEDNWQSSTLVPDHNGCARATGVSGSRFYLVQERRVDARTVTRVAAVESRAIDRRVRTVVNTDFSWWTEPVELTFDLEYHDALAHAGYQLSCGDTDVWWDTVLYPIQFSFDENDPSAPATATISPNGTRQRVVDNALGHECSLSQFQSREDNGGTYSWISAAQALDPIDLGVGDQPVPVALEATPVRDVTARWQTETAQARFEASYPHAVLDYQDIWFERAVAVEPQYWIWGATLGYGNVAIDASEATLPLGDPLAFGVAAGTVSYSASVVDPNTTIEPSLWISEPLRPIEELSDNQVEVPLLSPPMGVSFDGQSLDVEMSGLSDSPTVEIAPAPGPAPQGYRLRLLGRADDASASITVASSKPTFDLPPGVLKTGLRYTVIPMAMGCHDDTRPWATSDCGSAYAYYAGVEITE